MLLRRMGSRLSCGLRDGREKEDLHIDWNGYLVEEIFHLALKDIPCSISIAKLLFRVIVV